MKELFIYFKPTLECLFLHQSEWEEKVAVRPDQSRFHMMLCTACNKFFKYPTRQEDTPVYGKK